MALTIANNSNVWLKQSVAAVLLFLGLMGGFSSLSWGEDATETTDAATPVSEFAPDTVNNGTTKRYDQALTIKQITVKGNQLIDEYQIKDTMALKPGSLYNKSTLKDDLKRVYDLGYFTDKIRAVPIATREGIHLRIEVEENAPVTGVQIEGNSALSDEELSKLFEGQTGMPQNITQLNKTVESIEKMYADKGYILARVKTIADDPDGVINLSVNEGTIHTIRYVGNRKTKDYVLDRLMTVKSGQVYNEKALSEDLKRIFGTQSFSDVRRVIAASPENPDEYDVTVELDEKRTGAISLGGGVDTGTGLFGSVGYTDPNFRGRGENFSSVAMIGTGVVGRGESLADARTYQFEVGWSTPSFRQTDNSLGVSTYARDMASLNIPLGIERRIGTSLTWSRPIKRWENTAFSLGFGGEHVSMREGGSSDDLADLGITNRGKQLTSGTFINVTPTLAFDTRDNRFNPTSGWLNTVSLTGAMGLSGGSYGTASANVRKFTQLREGVVLALNAQGGTSLMGDVPTFNMFRLGGPYSVRGFQMGGLGIGNGFMQASAEIRTKVPLWGKMKDIPVLNTMTSAFFLDAGQVIGQEQLASGDYAQSGFGASLGAGLRFNIPGVGPLRVDYALPIAGGNSKYYQRFNFGVGQKF
ncbi:MAG: BamA/TamA family outer membrane protein [Vampirovibrionales bacterium]